MRGSREWHQGAPPKPRAPAYASLVVGLTAGTGLVAVGGPLPDRPAAAPPVPDPARLEPVPVAPAERPGGFASGTQEFPGVPYNGAFTFVRIRFNTGARGFGGGFGRGGGPPWAHDYPYADDNFVRILDEVTLLGPNTEATNVIDADDPALHSHPVAYVAEPGWWAPTQAEVDNIAAYLGKGGFLILDDFRGAREWRNVEAIFGAVLPGHRFRVLELEEPVFNSFFRIETLDLPPPTFRQYTPVFLGLHEDDDPDRRLMVVANFNNDIGDYWEYSDMGYYPIDLSNEAYKFGVNYVIYALNR